ncbi:PTS transporter subunit EIIC [Vibrio sinaloensis]|nr:PTS transporter subunit EIIC [Vibrio sinaloensis]
MRLWQVSRYQTYSHNHFWDFYIFIGGSGATLALVMLMSFSRSAHLKSIGRMSAVPGFFQINEPVIFRQPDSDEPDIVHSVRIRPNH